MNDKGFAVVGSAVIIALAVFMGFSAAVVVQRGHLLHQARLTQQKVARATHESLRLAVNRKSNETKVNVSNKGSVPAVISAWATKRSGGGIIVRGIVDYKQVESWPDGTLFYTQYSTADPESLEEGKQAFQDAQDQEGYCKTSVTDFTSVSNSGVCGGSSGDISYFFQAVFLADEAGDWSVRLGPDFGNGGGIILDGTVLAADWTHNLWWAGNWAREGDVLSGTTNIERGWHILTVYGFEPCCDGAASMQFKRPGDTWTAWSTDNLEIRHRDSPLVPPTAFYYGGAGIRPVSILGSGSIEIPWRISDNDRVGVVTRLGNTFWEGVP